MARQVLAPCDRHRAAEQVHVSTTQILHFDRAHRGICSDDRGTVDVFPIGIAGGRLEEPTLLVKGQCSPYWSLLLGEVAHPVLEPSSTGADETARRAGPGDKEGRWS